jgi:hypothetical protein
MSSLWLEKDPVFPSYLLLCEGVAYEMERNALNFLIKEYYILALCLPLPACAVTFPPPIVLSFRMMRAFKRLIFPGSTNMVPS